MLLATCSDPTDVSSPWLAALADSDVVDLAAACELPHMKTKPDTLDPRIFSDMISFFAAGHEGRKRAEELLHSVRQARAAGDGLELPDGRHVIRPRDEVRFHAPVPRPRRIRDYLTYRQHASGAGLSVPPAFEAMPIGYQCNVDSVIGPEEEIPWPAYTDQLDYELEVGFFVGPGGRDLSPQEAGAHIAGVTLFNDVSARDIQMFEMSMTIGPSKGKDFCNVLGPVVATLDEIDEDAIELTARVNGEVWSHGTTENRQFSFAEVLAWASYAEDVHPGEFLAIGTVGGGCGAELDRWIQPGDMVELEASGIGVLRNRVGARTVPPTGAGLPSYQGAPRFTLPGT